MKKWLVIWMIPLVLALVGISVLVGGCAQKAAAGPKILKLGTDFVITGPLATVGVNWVSGVGHGCRYGECSRWSEDRW